MTEAERLFENYGANLSISRGMPPMASHPIGGSRVPILRFRKCLWKDSSFALSKNLQPEAYVWLVVPFGLLWETKP
jgi:hypothetical protein